MSRVLTAAAALVLHGDRLRVDHTFPLVMAAAARPYSVVGAAALAAVLAARRHPAGALLGAVTAAALPGLLRRLHARPLPAPETTDVIILAANVLHGRADTGALATLLEREAPDFVALSEAGCDYRDKLLPLISGLGYRAWVSTPPSVHDGDGVVLLAGPRAGDVTVLDGPEIRRRFLRVHGGLLGDRCLIAVHTAAPFGLARTRAWRGDMRLLARWSHEEITPIIAGDLNATLDHAELQRVLGPCRSAVEDTRQGLVATFPANLPRWAGIHIDHVLVPNAMPVTRYAILDLPGTDHRAVLTSVRLPR